MQNIERNNMKRLIYSCLLLFAFCLSAQTQAFLAPHNPLGTVTVAWDPSLGTNVIARYNIYYGVGSREYTNVVSAGTSTTLTISNLVRGATYYFAATAVDTFGLESDFSAEVSCTIPAPPQPPGMRPLVILTVQSTSSVSNGQWADAGMAWSLSPNQVSQVFRLSVSYQAPAPVMDLNFGRYLDEPPADTPPAPGS
jgi:hypothetical protein